MISYSLQELYDRLDPDNSISEGPSIDLSMRVSHLKEFLPVLGERLQALDAEYQLSRKLSAVAPFSLASDLMHTDLVVRN